MNGDTERAITLIKRAMRLNPYYPDWYLWHLGEAHFDNRDYTLAIHTLNQMYDKTEAYRMLTASHALLGQMSEARAANAILPMAGLGADPSLAPTYKGLTDAPSVSAKSNSSPMRHGRA